MGCCSRQGLVREHQGLEFDTSGYRKPVEGDEEGCDMGSLGLVQDEARCSILNHLKGFDGAGREAQE